MKKVLFSLDIRTWPLVTGGQWVRMGGLEDQESKTAGEEPGGPLGFLVSSFHGNLNVLLLYQGKPGSQKVEPVLSKQRLVFW